MRCGIPHGDAALYNPMKKLIGTKEFYRTVALLALPLLLQNAVSTFVNLLDNLMVGRIGTESMSGVSIVNQILFVYNLCLFGGCGGASIFAAQFHGRRDTQGVRHALRFNLLLSAGFFLAGSAVLVLWGERFIGAFLHDAGGAGDLAATLSEGRAYLNIMLWGLFPFALTNAYVSILRVTGDNRLPMRASVVSILVNLVFNYLLIYGKLGFPVMGVRGAAWATVLARYVELGLILLGTHGKKEPPEFVRGLYARLGLPRKLAGEIFKKSLPLLVNEMFWSMGMTILTQCYSYRGLEAVAALNIANTATNFFNTVLFTMGNIVGIILGNLLGAEEYDRARRESGQLIFLSAASSAAVGAVMLLTASWIPRLYRTEPSIMALATGLLIIMAFSMPNHAIGMCSYWTLRAGGRTYITMAFDSGFTWAVSVPLAFALIHYTALGLLWVYLLVMLADLIKLAVGLILVHKGIWVRNLVKSPAVSGTGSK